MPARIYKPTKTAMQSGRANTRKWVLEFEPKDAKRADPLMGWAGSRDTEGQLRLRFDKREEAVAYCERHGIDFAVSAPETAPLKIKAYADNFRFDRIK
jgi:hypothetical protein